MLQDELGFIVLMMCLKWQTSCFKDEFIVVYLNVNIFVGLNFQT